MMVVLQSMLNWFGCLKEGLEEGRARLTLVSDSSSCVTLRNRCRMRERASAEAAISKIETPSVAVPLVWCQRPRLRNQPIFRVLGPCLVGIYSDKRHTSMEGMDGALTWQMRGLSPVHLFIDLALLLHTIRYNRPLGLVRRPTRVTPSLLNPPFGFFLFNLFSNGTQAQDSRPVRD